MRVTYAPSCLYVQWHFHFVHTHQHTLAVEHTHTHTQIHPNSHKDTMCRHVTKWQTLFGLAKTFCQLILLQFAQTLNKKQKRGRRRRRWETRLFLIKTTLRQRKKAWRKAENSEEKPKSCTIQLQAFLRSSSEFRAFPLPFSFNYTLTTKLGWKKIHENRFFRGKTKQTVRLVEKPKTKRKRKSGQSSRNSVSFEMWFLFGFFGAYHNRSCPAAKL